MMLALVTASVASLAVCTAALINLTVVTESVISLVVSIELAATPDALPQIHAEVALFHWISWPSVQPFWPPLVQVVTSAGWAWVAVNLVPALMAFSVPENRKRAYSLKE
ncbi:MAG: hypothetical protein NTX64_18930, partial [Elusimicrobia bacterium]|nr:hypothetical protein [Elusimicrobiota bacterium]